MIDKPWVIDLSAILLVGIILYCLYLVFSVFLYQSSIGTMYTYRIAETVDGITSHNTGDLKGDNSYISGEYCGRHGTEECGKGVMSRYTVQYDNSLVKNAPIPSVYPGFGDYALCNPGGNIGGTVSKDGPYICTNENCPAPDDDCISSPGVEVDRFSGGYWYSWPGELECKDSEKIGDNGCKWKLIEEPVSVTVKDLIKKGYQYLSQDEYDAIKDSDTKDQQISEKVEKYKESNINILEEAFSNAKTISSTKQQGLGRTILKDKGADLQYKPR